MNRRQALIAVAVLASLFGVSTKIVLHTHREAASGAERISPNPELLSQFPDRSPDQAAILLLEDSMEALPAKRALEPAGVPFCVTKSLDAALKHRLVFIPSGDQRLPLTPDDVRRLVGFASAGGVLILQAPAENAWPELTGLRDFEPSRGRKRIVFKASSDPGFAYLREPEETELPLASEAAKEGPWTVALTPQASTTTAVLATFDGGEEAALVRERIGAGAVYTIGLNLRDVIVRPQAGRSFDAQRTAFNGFEPAADIFPLIFRAWFEHSAPSWARLRAAPGEARAMFLVSHDVGPGSGVVPAEGFSALEARKGVHATYFIQTKYVLDKVEAPFFNAPVLALLARLRKDGHEIASLGVSASPELDTFDLGTGAETIKDYRPEVRDYGRTWDGNLLGELHVSKMLLEQKEPGASVKGFRSRLFSYPDVLDDVLARESYLYDSSLRAPECLTHFPYTLVHRRAMVRESDIVELPMTFEDTGKDEGAVAAAPILSTLRKIAAYEGTFVWLITPSAEGSKLPVLRSVLDGLPKGIKTMTLGEAARFWRARAQTRFWFEGSGRRLSLHLLLPEDGAEGLSFELSRPIASCRASPSLGVKCSGRILTLQTSAGAGPAEVSLDLE